MSVSKQIDVLVMYHLTSHQALQFISGWLTQRKVVPSKVTALLFLFSRKQDDFLFPSRKHGYHVSTTQVYRFLVKAGKTCGRNDIGTHTMRKTFGYWYYKQGGSIENLMHIFNHSSEAITKRYIGIDQEDIEKSLQDFHIYIFFF